MSVVADGPLAGRTLRSLVRRRRVSLLGRGFMGNRFPLLIKILHTRERLSAQVHPDDRCAKAMRLKDAGKTEAWVVLHARAGGGMLSGLKSQHDITRLRRLAESGALGRHMRAIRPKTGWALLCRAGTIHALGPGLVLLEIQQNSDSTFRLYDWGRMGLNGKPRPLHIEQSIRAAGKRPKNIERQRPKRLGDVPFQAERLVACDKFVVDRWRLRRAARREKPRRFEILHVVEGSGSLASPDWPAVRLSRGRTVLIPACTPDYQITPSRMLGLIRAAEPE